MGPQTMRVANNGITYNGAVDNRLITIDTWTIWTQSIGIVDNSVVDNHFSNDGAVDNARF